DTTVDTLCHGADLGVPGISKVHSDIQVGELVAVVTLKEELVSIGEAVMISKDMQKKPKGIAVKAGKVFMDPGTYPKMSRAKSAVEKKEDNEKLVIN
ncbi:RNA-guided pseudouridylation complex pseudouridine synthase subunit Cbf5, partial [Candidatus Woesearchaeota archaeon]|nr:RNA-guided pseudouridylation complex pseudouridine synthase subunit Cbf5 [Candidatus Woesearchaeota archaeon]